MKLMQFSWTAFWASFVVILFIKAIAVILIFYSALENSWGGDSVGAALPLGIIIFILFPAAIIGKIVMGLPTIVVICTEIFVTITYAFVLACFCTNPKKSPPPSKSDIKGERQYPSENY